MPVCPRCGFAFTKKSRPVVQTDGKLKEYSGDIYRQRATLYKSNTSKLWEKCYYRAKNSRNKMTFNQARALFFYENHYYPPSDIPLMPLDLYDWFSPVANIPPIKLTGRETTQ